MSIEAAATKLRELRDSEMAVGRGPKPRGEDYEWIEELIAAYAGVPDTRLQSIVDAVKRHPMWGDDLRDWPEMYDLLDTLTKEET